MKLKLDEQGHVVLENGLPVWESEDGKAIAYDVPRLVADLSRVNGESAGRRKEIDALTEQLRNFEGIEPARARAVLDLAANLDAGKLLEAGKVEELKAAVARGWQDKVAALEKAHAEEAAQWDGKLKAKDDALRRHLVEGLFASSAYLREKTVLPPDMACAAFGKHFEVQEDNGELRVVGSLDGKPIFSRARPGNLASPDEAIEALVEAYPQKDRILRTSQGGSGTQGNGGQGGGNRGAGKSLSRGAFDALPPAEKASFFRDGGTLNEN